MGYGLTMPDYTRFKKSFCDCCKTKKDGKCLLGIQHSRTIRDHIDFIDWEAVMDTKDPNEHDLPRCDSVYFRDNITFFIEQKNAKCFFVDNSSEPKDPEDFTEILFAKFETSKRIFGEDAKLSDKIEYVFSYDFNDINEQKRSFLERNLRNIFFVRLDLKGIIYGTCDQVAYHTIHGTEIGTL